MEVCTPPDIYSVCTQGDTGDYLKEMAADGRNVELSAGLRMSVALVEGYIEHLNVATGLSVNR